MTYIRRFLARLFGVSNIPLSNKESTPTPTRLQTPHLPPQRPMPVTLRVELPDDRTKLGSLIMLDNNNQICVGPHPIMGYADPNRAQQNKNPLRERNKPFGDTPLGTYTIVNWIPVPGHLASVLGKHGAFVLDPTDGEALDARPNGRGRILLHGGTSWTPTDGALRVDDNTMKEIVEQIGTTYLEMPIRVDVVEAIEDLEYGIADFSTISLEDDGSLLDLYWQYVFYYSDMQPWPQESDPQPAEEEVIQRLNEAGYDIVPNDPVAVESERYQPEAPVCTFQDPTGQDTTTPSGGAYDR